MYAGFLSDTRRSPVTATKAHTPPRANTAARASPHAPRANAASHLAQAHGNASLTACFGGPRGPLRLGAVPSPRPAHPSKDGIDYSPQHAARR